MQDINKGTGGRIPEPGDPCFDFMQNCFQPVFFYLTVAFCVDSTTDLHCVMTDANRCDDSAVQV